MKKKNCKKLFSGWKDKYKIYLLEVLLEKLVHFCSKERERKTFHYIFFKGLSLYIFKCKISTCIIYSNDNN